MPEKFSGKLGPEELVKERAGNSNITIEHTDWRTKSNAKIQMSCHLLQENQLQPVITNSFPLCNCTISIPLEWIDAYKK
jgi:hypothetical protein